MKNSKQRDLILNIINSSYDHPSAYQIYDIAKKSIANISLGTVYRNLNFLLSNDMIKKIKTNDNADRYDKILNRHSHFLCDICNDIIDIYDDNVDIKSIGGNKVLDYDIIYTGICHNCLKEEKK